MKLWIRGNPATFATVAEDRWKEILRRHILPPLQTQDPGKGGIILIFHLASFTRNGQAFDIDNLVEPVFSILINEKGYFKGRRTNIRWWYAKKEKDSDEGLEIEISSCPPEISRGRIIIDEVYTGPLPESAKSKDLPAWLKSKNIKPIEGRFSLYLKFPEKINIGDIATGRVKHTIDCLYPIIGGDEKSPEDWRIEELIVEKGGGEGIKLKLRHLYFEGPLNNN